MSKVRKQLENMRHNPLDWRIEDLKIIADKTGLLYRQPGTSHVTFRAQSGQKVTVPVRKPANIKRFIELIDELLEDKQL
jgi:predicted RNA binding protein YcfA (HicA-like mRNA interferase family)